MSSSNQLPLPGTITGGATNLSEYRALLQVLGFATHHHRDAAGVVMDAWIGGVVSTFCDKQGRTPSHALFPSPKSVELLSPLIAQGFFSPSLSSTLDNPFAIPYQPLTESNGRDGFTLVSILFPDCFLDVPAAAERSASGSVEDSHNSPLTAAAFDAMPDANDTVKSRDALTKVLSTHASQGASRSTTPAVQGQQPPPTPSLSHLRSVGPPSNTSATNDNNNNSNSLNNVFASSSLLTVPSTPPAAVDLLLLHRCRQRVALLYLSMVTDTLRDVQVRELLIRKKKADPEHVDGELVIRDVAEVANIRAVGNMMEKLKALLLSCLCATELAYRPLLNEAVGDAPSSALSERTPVPPRNAVAMNGLSACYVPQPRHMLTAKLACEDFFTPVEEWSVWQQQAAGSVAWYDGHLARLCEVFAAATQTDFAAYLTSLQVGASQDCARALAREPELLLHRSTDGHGGVSLPLTRCTGSGRNRPALPFMPILPGEMAYFFHVKSAQLLFDDAPSPVMAALSRWSQCRLAKPQLDEESMAFFGESVAAWADLSPVRQQAILDSFVKNDEVLCRALQLNPVLVARVALWIDGRYGKPSTAHRCGEVTASSGAVRDILLGQPFSVPVAYFFRELVDNKALSEDIFLAWLALLAGKVMEEDSTLFPHYKTILTLLEFVRAATNWDLKGTLQPVMDELKKRR